MKKKILLIFSLLLSILFINTVNAKEFYRSKWTMEDEQETFSSNILEYNGGYLLIKESENEIFLEAYSENGELIKTKEIAYALIENALVDGENLYLYVYDHADDYYCIRMYDKNLKFKAEYETAGESYMSLYMNHELAGLRVKNGYLYALEELCNHSCAFAVEKIELDLSDGEIVEDEEELMKLSSIFTEKNIDVLFEESYMSVPNYLSDYNVESWTTPDYKDGKFLFGLYTTKDKKVCYEEDDIYGECYTKKILVLEKGKEILNIDLGNKTYELLDARFVDDNIAVVEYDYSEGIELINIYNQKGELIQNIEYEGEPGYISEISKGFALVKGISYCTDVASRQIDFSSQKKCLTEGNDKTTQTVSGSCIPINATYEVFYRYFDVSTKVSSGKGSITVDQEHQLGDQVTFTVTPDEGYVLKSVKVTDSEGNTVTFTENQFTMPADDITIEAEFAKIEEKVKENPNTKDIAVIFVLILAITTCIITLVLCNKIKRVGY